MERKVHNRRSRRSLHNRRNPRIDETLRSRRNPRSDGNLHSAVLYLNPHIAPYTHAKVLPRFCYIHLHLILEVLFEIHSFS